MSKMIAALILVLLLLPPAVLCCAAAGQATANAINVSHKGYFRDS
jgi:hypothetical protein